MLNYHRSGFLGMDGWMMKYATGKSIVHHNLLLNERKERAAGEGGLGGQCYEIDRIAERPLETFAVFLPKAPLTALPVAM